MKVDLTKEELRWLSDKIGTSTFQLNATIWTEGAVGRDVKYLRFLMKMQKKLDKAKESEK